MRVNRAQEFVIGGYTLRGRHFDALIFGYWEAVAPAVPATEDAGVSVREPARGAGGALGDGLTAAKMKDCRWLRPVPMGQFEFVEWTQKKHLGIRGLRLGDKWGIRDKVNAIPG
jgi:bifunctional non-homologous end joining protein LigD